MRAAEVFRAPRAPRANPERRLQAEIVHYLKSRGCLVAVTDAGAAYRAGRFFGDAIPVGWADITAITPEGRPMLVEVKAPDGRQSAEQRAFQQSVLARPLAIYVLAYSLADVQRAIP